MIFLIFSTNVYVLMMGQNVYADVGRRRPADLPRRQRRGEPGALIAAGGADSAQDLADIEESLDRLLADVQDVALEDLPRGLQRHMVGVPARFSQFLRKLGSLVAMYRAHRP